jgi:KTSC domain
MRRIWIDSSGIASIGYEAAARELEIEFRDSGDLYGYFDVPREEYAALLAAESKGTYLNQVFKPQSTVMLWSPKAEGLGFEVLLLLDTERTGRHCERKR